MSQIDTDLEPGKAPGTCTHARADFKVSLSYASEYCVDMCEFG